MPFFEVFENFSYHLYDIGCLSMIYTLKYAKSESNFDTDFEHPTQKVVRSYSQQLFGCILSHKAFVLTPLTSLNSLTSRFAKEFLIFINMLPQR